MNAKIERSVTAGIQVGRSLCWALLGLGVLLLAGCGGGGGAASTPVASVPTAVPVTAAAPTLSFAAVKAFHFGWADVSDATHYKLLENPDGVSGFTQVGSDIPQGTQRVDHIVPLYARLNAQYILQSCNATGCTDSSTVSVSGSLVASIGYLKASNTGAGDAFGYVVSLSGDGSTLAVGAFGESSNATGVDGDQTDHSAVASGAVYVFTRSGSSWSQQAYIKASNTEAGDNFGITVSLSGDGNTLAVGADREDSRATLGDQTDNSFSNSGAVYVFTRNGSSWSQQAYIKGNYTASGDKFGVSVSLSGDGSTLAIGAYQDGSASTGVANVCSGCFIRFVGTASNSGAVYVFAFNGSRWKQRAYVKASNTGIGDAFGISVSLSGDGNTLAVGAYKEDSIATGIDGDQGDNSATTAGAVYVFTQSGSLWRQQAYVKASNAGAGDAFGISVSLSGDGSTLAVGAFGEDSFATGIDGDQGDGSATDAGAVYVFTQSGSLWRQQAYVKASNAGAGDAFGYAVSLSGDGSTLAVGALGEDSFATGIDGDQSDGSATDAGAAYVFTLSGLSWSQQAYVKASNTGGGDNFGTRVSLSGDGSTLAMGAWAEAGNATGINGDDTDNSATTAGAVYLY